MHMMVTQGLAPKLTWVLPEYIRNEMRSLSTINLINDTPRWRNFQLEYWRTFQLVSTENMPISIKKTLPTIAELFFLPYICNVLLRNF